MKHNTKNSPQAFDRLAKSTGLADTNKPEVKAATDGTTAARFNTTDRRGSVRFGTQTGTAIFGVL